MTAPEADLALVGRVADELLARPPRAGSARVLAIDGRSGAGKSTFGQAVAARLAAPLVQMEFLYPGWDGLEAGIGILVDEVLIPVSQGRPASVPQWDYAAGTWGEPVALAPAAAVVVEGVGCGDRRAAAFASLLVWLELDAASRRARALARDAEMYRPHWDSWARQEDALLARERTWERADLVVATAS